MQPITPTVSTRDLQRARRRASKSGLALASSASKEKDSRKTDNDGNSRDIGSRTEKHWNPEHDSGCLPQGQGACTHFGDVCSSAASRRPNDENLNDVTKRQKTQSSLFDRTELDRGRKQQPATFLDALMRHPQSTSQHSAQPTGNSIHSSASASPNQLPQSNFAVQPVEKWPTQPPQQAPFATSMPSSASAALHLLTLAPPPPPPPLLEFVQPLGLDPATSHAMAAIMATTANGPSKPTFLQGRNLPLAEAQRSRADNAAATMAAAFAALPRSLGPTAPQHYRHLSGNFPGALPPYAPSNHDAAVLLRLLQQASGHPLPLMSFPPAPIAAPPMPMPHNPALLAAIAAMAAGSWRSHPIAAAAAANSANSANSAAADWAALLASAGGGAAARWPDLGGPPPPPPPPSRGSRH